MKHAIGLALLGVIVILVAVTTPPKATALANRIDWDGQSRFVAGANMPWFNWACDFGCGAAGGASSPSVRAAVDQRIVHFRSTGMDVIRWSMFEPSGPNGAIWQIRRGTSGQLEVNPIVYADIDAALAIAEARDVYLVFNLFAGVGRFDMPAAWLNDPAMRIQLANALGPMFTRYATNPRLMAWDIFNEPEWPIWSGEANQANAVALADLIADQIHARAPTLVTIGEATADGIPIWDDAVSLDFHSPHWYSSESSGSGCVACRTYGSVAAQYDTSKPVVVGEWDAPDGLTTLARWNHWEGAGYAGAWAWSIVPERTSDKIPFGYATASLFMAAKLDPLRPAPTPPPPGAVSGGFTGLAPASGSPGLLVTSAPSSPDQLSVSLDSAGCQVGSLAVLQDENWRLWIRGALAAANAAFPPWLPESTPFFVRCDGGVIYVLSLAPS